MKENQEKTFVAQVDFGNKWDPNICFSFLLDSFVLSIFPHKFILLSFEKANLFFYLGVNFPKLKINTLISCLLKNGTMHETLKLCYHGMIYVSQ
jgi:hypothetical protein